MVDELTAMFRVCKHIKRDGFRCNSPAMTGMNFCFHHIGGKVASLVREGATYDASAQLDFDYPADRESIQQNLMLVAQALREGKIDNQTANTYIRIFRLAEQNLHRWEKKQKNSEKTKMQPPADEAAPTNDVIPNEVRDLRFASGAATDGGPLKPAVGLSGEQTTSNEVIPTGKGAPRLASETSGAPRLDSETWERSSATDPIPSAADPNDLSFQAERSAAEEPAVLPGPPTTIVIPTEVSEANEAEEPALSPSAQPTQPNQKLEPSALNPPNQRRKSPQAQYMEDVYYGRIPCPENLEEVLAQL